MVAWWTLYTILQLCAPGKRSGPSTRGYCVSDGSFMDSLQSKLGEETDGSQLSAMLPKPVPLLRGRDLDAVDLRSLPRYLPSRRSCAMRDSSPGLSRHCGCPYQLGVAFARLYDALVKVLGKERVRRTSEGAHSIRGSCRRPALRRCVSWITSKNDSQGDVATASAFCLPMVDAKLPPWEAGSSGRNGTSSARTELRFGVFPPVFSSKSFYDQPDGVLLVSEALQPFEILESSWVIAGPGHRDLWAAYARDLNLGRF